jgi:hypothetical protein
MIGIAQLQSLTQPNDITGIPPYDVEALLN